MIIVAILCRLGNDSRETRCHKHRGVTDSCRFVFVGSIDAFNREFNCGWNMKSSFLAIHFKLDGNAANTSKFSNKAGYNTKKATGLTRINLPESVCLFFTCFLIKVQCCVPFWTSKHVARRMKYGNNAQPIQGSLVKMTSLNMPCDNNITFALVGIT